LLLSDKLGTKVSDSVWKIK